MKKKMKISLCIFFFILFNSIVFSQNNVIEYKSEVNKSNIIGIETLKSYPNIESNLRTIALTLVYNENEMKFYSNKISPLKNDDTEITLLVADIQGIYYRKNNFNDLFIKIDKYYDQENFIIKKKFITDWKITGEKKIICGYECFKATCDLKVDYGDNEINTLYPVTAWYCPLLEYSYGPKGIGGLPGMILELEQNLVIYRASKIFTRKTMENTTMPSDIKVITESEMYSLFEQSTKEFNNK